MDDKKNKFLCRRGQRMKNKANWKRGLLWGKVLAEEDIGAYDPGADCLPNNRTAWGQNDNTCSCGAAPPPCIAATRMS